MLHDHNEQASEHAQRNKGGHRQQCRPLRSSSCHSSENHNDSAIACILHTSLETITLAAHRRHRQPQHTHQHVNNNVHIPPIHLYHLRPLPLLTWPSPHLHSILAFLLHFQACTAATTLYTPRPPLHLPLSRPPLCLMHSSMCPGRARASCKTGRGVGAVDEGCQG